jgi:methylated-DNA-[protein]-cysteine S-methyltransferase
MQRTTIDSPIGPLTLTADGDELVGVFMEDQRHRPAFPEPDSAKTEVLAQAERQLAEYFDGGRTTFELPLKMIGSPFQRRVWSALLEIPYGETASYGEIALRIGQPTAARAVGLANGRNPIAIVVPCHRVIGASGALTGYGGGLPRKQQLLALERRSGQLALPA